MHRVGDTLLGLLAKKEEAGACTECPGPCAYRSGYYCSGGARIYWYCNYYYTCDCGCVLNYCTYTHVGSC
jgi:hypothetical protein